MPALVLVISPNAAPTRVSGITLTDGFSNDGAASELSGLEPPLSAQRPDTKALGRSSRLGPCGSTPKSPAPVVRGKSSGSERGRSTPRSATNGAAGTDEPLLKPNGLPSASPRRTDPPRPPPSFMPAAASETASARVFVDKGCSRRNWSQGALGQKFSMALPEKCTSLALQPRAGL